MDDFQVRDEQMEQKLRDIGGRLRTALDGTGHGFALLIFTFGEGGNMFYTSNAQREDIVKCMQEFIAKTAPKGEG